MASTTTQLSIVNPTPKTLPGPGLLHHLVARESRNSNSAIEYTSTDGNSRSLSYEQLHLQSDTLASRIKASRTADGRATGERYIVPLYIEQCTKLYVSQLAVLKAGAAFCPIALDAPVERIRFILQDVQADLILTTSRLKPTLPDLDDVQIVCVDENLPESAFEGTLPTIDSSWPAYIMSASLSILRLLGANSGR